VTPHLAYASIVALFFSISLQAFAEDPEEGTPPPSRPVKIQKAILIGHNVTPTTETVKAGVFTLGNYAVGVGLTDHWFIATSPWIWVSYNTANAHIKWSTEINKNSKFALFGSYFHSYASSPLVQEIGGSKVGTRPGGPPPTIGGVGPHATAATVIYGGLNRYQWESASIHILYSYDFLWWWTSYFNLHYGYFWNDDFAYSIRMDPGKDSLRGQVDLTTLHTIKLSDSGFHFNLEAGLLGANYNYPYLQLGTSLAFISRLWLIQAGASATMQVDESGLATGWEPGRYDSRTHISASKHKLYYYRYLQTAVHPEIQLQFFF
jgi:hypothetical protein